MRAPMSELRVTSFLAPSSKDVMVSLDGCRMDRGPTLCVRSRVGRLRTLRGGIGHPGLARGEAQVVDPAGRALAAARGPRARSRGVEQVDVARRSPSSSSVTDARGRRGPARRASRTAWSPKTASSSFWPSTAEPPAMPASAPVTPGGVGEDDDHQRHREPVDAVGQEPRGGALVGALGADHLEHVLLPVAHRPLGPAAEVARGAAEVLARACEQGLAGGRATARTPRPARRRPRRARGSASRGRTRRRR